MSGVILEIDPTSEDAANVSLVLVDNTSYFLLSEDWPEPEVDQMTVSSVTTEGEQPVSARHHNTTGTFSLRVIGTTAADLQTKLNYIDKKLAKVMREGGTLKRTSPSGATAVADLLSGTQGVGMDWRYTANNRAVATVTLARRPYWRLAQVTLTLHSELTKPAIGFVETAIQGDVPALGRLIVTEGQGVDQFWVVWGIASRFYSSSADAQYFYEAEGRSALGGSATAIGATGASGTGSNVMRSAALTTSYMAILSTQATGGGNHLSHIGDFQVYARVQTPTANTGQVSIALEWGVGDYLRATQNDAVTFPADTYDGTWRFVNLGQVSVPKVAQGTQRWEGRILAKSTVQGDKVDVDYLMFVPVTEGSGVVSGVTRTSAPTSVTASDTFDQVSATFAAATMTVGGAWSSAGSTTDFTIDTTNHQAQRNTTSDAAPRFGIAGTTLLTNAGAKVSVGGGGVGRLGVILRYIDTANYAAAYINGTSSVAFAVVIAGVATTTTATLAGGTNNIQAVAYASGAWSVATSLDGVTFTTQISGQDANLATGGTLASGKVGLYDYNSTSTSRIRTYDNFFAWVPVPDAAVFASKQLEIRNDRVIRQDATGTIWATPSKYEGDYLLIPPAGREGRSVAGIVKACRNDPATGPDPAIDDISVQLVYTPRVLTLPE